MLFGGVFVSGWGGVGRWRWGARGICTVINLTWRKHIRTSTWYIYTELLKYFFLLVTCVIFACLRSFSSPFSPFFASFCAFRVDIVPFFFHLLCWMTFHNSKRGLVFVRSCIRSSSCM